MVRVAILLRSPFVTNNLSYLGYLGFPTIHSSGSKEDSHGFNDVPPEIVSEILLYVMDSFGDGIRLKWRFPLLFRRVSKRFYDITNGTPFVWRYLYIRGRGHHFLHNHISRSGSLPLVANVMHSGLLTESGIWREIINFMVPILPRLICLTIYSPSHPLPIVELLRHEMPMLNSLDIKGTRQRWEEEGLLSRHLPALRHLRSTAFFTLANSTNLPETLEELYIGHTWSIPLPQRIWSMLPPKLRILQIETMPVHGVIWPPEEEISLPYLTELRLPEEWDDGEVSILQILRAPCLQVLEVIINDAERDHHQAPLSLDFPALTRIKWRSESPQQASLLRECRNLASVHIKAEKRSMWTSELVAALANDSSFLPHLTDLVIYKFCTTVPTLKKVAQSRPQLKRIEVHQADIALPESASKAEHAEWYGGMAWLAAHIDLHVNDHEE